MLKPEKPSESDCCGSGCTPCVFDVYEEQLKKWGENASSPLRNSQVFNTLKYSPFKLINIQVITKDTNLYTFQGIGENQKLIPDRISFKTGDYAILKSPEVSRPYTIINNDYLKRGMFQVLIKIYPDGIISQFLSTIKINDILFWRGPYNTLDIKTKDKIILVGAGTGVVPLYNIALELVQNENCDSLIELVLAFNTLDEILLRSELSELACYWNCKIIYYLSRDNGKKPGLKENVSYGRLNEIVFENFFIGNVSNVFVVICGPKAFNEMCMGVCNRLGLSEENYIVL